MGMDRNTIMGFVLIGMLLIGMFYINSKSSQAFQREQKHIADSMASLQPKKDTIFSHIDSLHTDSLMKARAGAAFQKPASLTPQYDSLENDKVKIIFSNMGGRPVSVLLKNYHTWNGQPIILAGGAFARLSYSINAGANQTPQTADIPFLPGVKSVNSDKSSSISFSLKDSTGRELVHQYTIRTGDFMVDMTITGADKFVTNNTINLLWQAEAKQAEKVISYEKQQSTVCWYKNDKYDFESRLSEKGEENFDSPTDWLALRQQFFINAISAKNKFQTAHISWELPDDSLQLVARTTANLRINIPGGQHSIPLQLFYGPSDYHILKQYDNNMYNIVPYGSGPFSFVKYINRHFLLPIWDFLRSNFASYGIIILLLTLVIRLITSPILYKSYLSGAKMKALKPEVDELKAKFKDDKQAFGVEQMKLWKSAGVSPLGGCLPALLQIPIFMSLFYFFQSNISLRGQHFLWAKDLASYDSIFDFEKIPVLYSLYGDHISLFTLTAVITSLLISLYSMSNMQTNDNPVMKYMPYIFPVLLLGVFNRLPAALTWYYTISNTITLILQFVIQKYIISHDKIRAQIDENRKKPRKKSKLAERLELMQENQRKLQESRNKPGRR